MPINIRQFDPPNTIEYLNLLNRFLLNYRTAKSHDGLVEAIGLNVLQDVSNRPDVQQLDAQDPLPINFVTHTYQYWDGRSGRGMVEVVFDNINLVNVRCLFSFYGWFSKRKAKKYLSNVLIPSFEIAFGPAEERCAHHAKFTWKGIAVLTRYVPGTTSVSTYLVDEAYM